MYDAITPALPTHGLIKDYLEYSEGGEVCPRFRLFAFLSAMGSVIRRKVKFNRTPTGSIVVYPNPWVVLVAPQGVGHKSSALKKAKRFVDRLPMELRPIMMASKLTPEALVKSLASQLEASAQKTDAGMVERLTIYRKKAQGLLYSSEFGVLLGREKYNMGMIALLTDLYDCPDEWNSETIMRGDQRMYDVCLSVMAASTPDWMQSMLPSDAFKGGFMSRLILVGFPENWEVRVAEIPEGEEALRNHIQAQLEVIAKLTGEMTWTEGARKIFVDWYNNLPRTEPGPQAAYLERKQDHMLKIAMLLQLSYDKQFVIGEEAMSTSLNILNAIEAETLSMIEYISVEPRMRAVQRVVELLMAGDKTEAQLLSESWKYLHRPNEYDDIINLLVRSKKVIPIPKGTTMFYRLAKQNEEEKC